MATIKRELSQKKNGNGKSEIICRVSICRGVQPRLKSGIFIDPTRFKDGAIIKPRANRKEAAELQKLESDLTALEQYLLDYCTAAPREQLTKESIAAVLDRYRHPDRVEAEESPADFFGAFDEFLEKRSLSKVSIKNFRVLYRALRRYELYRAAIGDPYVITFDTLTAGELERFRDFLRAEPELFNKYPTIYAEIPADTHAKRKSPRPVARGNNTICGIFKLLRIFFNSCVKKGLTENRPFEKFTIGSQLYGRPYYITIEERDTIADHDFSASPAMEAQRDIFIFHCLIGCRVSDLMRLTPANIINGAVEYIAHKTKGERPEVIRVPLHRRALALVAKYEGRPDGRLFPFISSQKYNDAIKDIFKACGITRPVTILNAATGEEEQRPINEIASSHIARRTFCGNLYKQVKDPNLVGALSGHKEGSRAFARYRDIDEDMKKDLINLLGR